MKSASGSGKASSPLQFYLRSVVAVGSMVLLRAALEAARTPHPLAWMTLAGLALVSAWFRLNLKSISATVGIDDTFCITAALLFGPGPATLALGGHSANSPSTPRRSRFRCGRARAHFSR